MWKTKKLGDVLTTSAGGTPLKSKKNYYAGGAIKWLLSGAVCEKDIHDSKTHITEEGLANSSAKLFPSNTVLVAMYGATAGQVGILRTEAATNQAVCGIYPNEDYLPEFLYYYLINYKETLLLEVSGVAQPNLSQVKIKNIPLPLISLAEQQRIVAKLDAAFAEIDVAIETAAKNIQNSRHFYSHAIDSEFSKYSKEAESIGEHSKVNYGYTAKASFEKGKYKFLRITDIQNNAVDWNSVPYCEVEPKKLPVVLLKDGDIVFARTGATTGKSFLVENPIDAVFASYLIRVSVDRGVLIPKYVMHFFQSAAYWQQVDEGISGAAQGGFNASKLSELRIPIINKTKQLELIQNLDLINEQSANLQNTYALKMQALNSLKSAILAQELHSEAA